MKMTDSPLVSVIIPIYRVPEDCLRRCIESVQAQTLQNIEIILVEDGSPDNCSLICDEYSQSDCRIRVIHKSNEGLSAARNTGFHAANGEWITFLDGDDWIENTTCEDTYKLGIDKNVDVVIFGSIQDYEKFHKPFKYHFVNGQVFENEQCQSLLSEILDFNGNIATAWAKLIRKELLDCNHIEHNEILRQGAEGIEFNIRLFEKVHKAVFLSNIYYHYVFNPESISSKHDEKNHYYVIKCFEEIEKQIEHLPNKDSLIRCFYDRFAFVIVATAISGYFSPVNNETFIEKKRAFLRYLSIPLVNESLKMYRLKTVGKKRAIVLFLIKHKCFLLVALLAILRFKQKH